MSRAKTVLTDRTKVSFEWFKDGEWIVQTPLIPNNALQYALRELRAQTEDIRNVHVVLAK